MQKFLFDKEIVANQLSVLTNTLNSQRQNKKTLLSYLEKFSNAMYDNFNSESTDLLLALIKEAHSVFECIKSNISKSLELKKFLENIYHSDFLNTIDSEKFNAEFNFLLENISKTNSSYLTFMNNYENFITQNLKDSIVESITQETDFVSPLNSTTFNSSNIDTFSTENDLIDNNVLDNSTDIDNFINNNIIIEETIVNNNLENRNIIENNSTNNNTYINDLSDESVSFETPYTSESSVNTNLTDNTLDNISENVENTSETEITSDTQNDFDTVSKSSQDYFSTYLQENVLIINKKEGFAILPYSISDLDELFLDNPEKYTSIQDIIDKEYTISLDEYENTSISRYKEAFKLAKEKSNYSFSQAANFAKNLLVESKVTTLIVAACKNVQELEYYLECLNNDQIDLFTSFKIIEK